MEQIFISHSSKDKVIVQEFIDDILNGSLMINIKDIFCTTTDGTKIKSGEDWRNSIKDHLENAKITFLIVTPNYKESEVCLNEMGAAWVLSGCTIPLVIEPINYESVGILQNVLQVEKLLDETSLDRIRDVLQECTIINAAEIKSDRWTAKKKEFLEKINRYLAINPFSTPVTKDMVEKLNERVEKLQNQNETNTTQIESLSNDNNRLIDQITEYRELLSSKDIAKIESVLRDSDFYKEFIRLCDEVKESLSQVNGIIPTIIYKSYSRKFTYINIEGWDQNIREAVARDILLDDEQLEPDWHTTKIMRNIHSKLDNLSVFIESNVAVEEFVSVYEDAFEAPLSIANLDFWKQVFDVKIYFD